MLLIQTSFQKAKHSLREIVNATKFREKMRCEKNPFQRQKEIKPESKSSQRHISILIKAYY